MSRTTTESGDTTPFTDSSSLPGHEATSRTSLTDTVFTSSEIPRHSIAEGKSRAFRNPQRTKSATTRMTTAPLSSSKRERLTPTRRHHLSIGSAGRRNPSLYGDKSANRKRLSVSLQQSGYDGSGHQEQTAESEPARTKGDSYNRSSERTSHDLRKSDRVKAHESLRPQLASAETSSFSALANELGRKLWSTANTGRHPKTLSSKSIGRSRAEPLESARDPFTETTRAASHVADEKAKGRPSFSQETKLPLRHEREPTLECSTDLTILKIWRKYVRKYDRVSLQLRHPTPAKIEGKVISLSIRQGFARIRDQEGGVVSVPLLNTVYVQVLSAHPRCMAKDVRHTACLKNVQVNIWKKIPKGASVTVGFMGQTVPARVLAVNLPYCFASLCTTWGVLYLPLNNIDFVKVNVCADPILNPHARG